MTIPVWNLGRVLYQTADEDSSLPEAAVLIHVDNGGALVLQQEGRQIVLNRASLAELLRELRAYLPGKP